jgi:hypothetical protein
MVAITLASPIRPGKHEAWRRFMQELQGLRRGQHEESCRRLGITTERAWLVETPEFALAILYLEVDAPQELIGRLRMADTGFDRWFQRQVLDLHGLDLSQLGPSLAVDLLFDWRAT